MWYLNRGRGHHMNVESAWSAGVSGRGVAVTILDDGIEKDHPDLIRNYDPLASTDINDNDSDPNPRYSPFRLFFLLFLFIPESNLLWNNSIQILKSTVV